MSLLWVAGRGALRAYLTSTLADRRSGKIAFMVQMLPGFERSLSLCFGEEDLRAAMSATA